MAIFGGIIVVLFIVLIALTNMTKTPGEYTNPITVEELQKENSKEKETFVYFYQTDCIYCKKTSPIVLPLAKEMNIDLKELNLQEDTAGWDEFNIEGTPTIVHFKNGKEINRLHGQQTEEVFREWFEENT